MTIREAAAGIIEPDHGTYNIGFVNDEGRDDETQFDEVKSVDELEELFSDFCDENNFPKDTVTYVEKGWED